LIELFRRSGDAWARFEARAQALLKLDSIGCELSADVLFDGIELRT